MIFLGDIAFYLATLVFAVGAFMLHHTRHHDGDKECRLLKFGGYFVITVSILGMLCTGYYWMKYWRQDVYAAPQMMGRAHMGMGNMSGMKMSKGMMGHQMMQGMQHCMKQMDGKMMDHKTVSYTHLTLPTNDRV